ncbi:unnamed protein product [Rotaria socialis]|uniref:Uncharacterized protein n=1 Tax=Rotaria socialis TaxID=392032 RepID=A0A817SBN0_9BILA|nr:unnamed protein product [Rotaria socialis]CAF3452370.1 unnamed protein product [Rotaria socialis]CAF3571073.1 unnamed protein product [Rotaria socialis]CAF4403801.1 unnamed protein product [Rotaria socialis]CAF4558527.1 unnamed protein product [Rotaria socialis]
MTCDLHKSCGISYRTYAAYKPHVYRYHSSLLHSTNEENFYLLTTNNTQQLNMDPNTDVNIMNDNVTINTINEDDEDDFSSDSIEADTCNDDQQQQATNIDSQNLFKSSCNEESNISFIFDIQKSFALFILQLREEFYLPKSTINSISNYIVTLINHLELLFKQKTIRNDLGNAKNISSSKTTSDSNNDIIELKIVKSTMKEYNPPEEVTISAPGEDLKCGYFVPIDQTLTSILRNQDTVDQIFDSMKKKEATIKDDDLMFPFRDGDYGSRIDDDSLLIQLYVDDIGLTNPIGVKKDRHNMFMVNFSLEDFPDQYRSQLEQIYLVAVCEGGILKKKILNNQWISFGILSQSTPMAPKSYDSPSFYGWGQCTTQTFLKGSNQKGYAGYDGDIKENDLIELIINSEISNIKLINHRSTKRYQIPIDPSKSPFPWKLSVNLVNINDRVCIAR